MKNRRSLVVIIFIALAALEYLIYFWHTHHFFQADTIYWFDHRLTSFAQFVGSFASPDPGGWYRPLTNRTVQSVLYPIFGLQPPVYRAVQFTLFFLDVVGVFALVWKLTRTLPAAVIGATFFTIHTINAYTTYDLAFVPELTYTLLYIGSAIAFLRFLESRQLIFWMASLLAFLLSLCSKESAVTLPAALFAIAYISGFRVKTISRNLVPHILLLTMYLLFTVGHLKIASEALESLHSPPAQVEAGGYYFMAGPHLFTNARYAWSWALNLPVGMLGEWRVITRMRTLVIWGFAIAQMLIAIYASFRGSWRPVLAGLAWFWIAVVPALPLMGHFLPYYLFLPVVGFSVIVGASWAQVYDDISARSRTLASALVTAIFSLLILVYSRTARSDAQNNSLLGGSSRIAETSLRDMHILYPSIAPGTKFLIEDDSEPDLSFHQADGGLFRLAYGDNSLVFQYSTSDQTKGVASGTLTDSVKLTYRDGHLRPSTH